jgi:hypothetical protein
LRYPREGVAGVRSGKDVAHLVRAFIRSGCGRQTGAPSDGPDPVAHSIASFLDESTTAARLGLGRVHLKNPQGSYAEPRGRTRSRHDNFNHSHAPGFAVRTAIDRVGFSFVQARVVGNRTPAVRLSAPPAVCGTRGRCGCGSGCPETRSDAP